MVLHVAKVKTSAAGALVASAFLLVGCGGGAPTRNAEALPGPSSVRAKSPVLPSERSIDAALRKPMAAPQDPKRALPALEIAPPKPNHRDTAPASAFELGERAAQQWLVYQINGDAPDAGVIPRRLWNSVPPAAPDQRMKGAAREGTKVIGAHPEDGGWIVSVATQDTRVSMIVVTVKRAGGRMKVTGVSG